MDNLIGRRLQDALLNGLVINFGIKMINKLSAFSVFVGAIFFSQAMHELFRPIHEPADAKESVSLDQQVTDFIRQHRADINLCRPLFIAEIEKKYGDACACIALGHEQELLGDTFEWAHCVPVSFTCSSWSFFKTLSPEELIGSIEALGRLRKLFGFAVFAPEAEFTFGRNYTIEFMGPEHLLKPMAERIRDFSAAFLAQLSSAGE